VEAVPAAALYNAMAPHNQVHDARAGPPTAVVIAGSINADHVQYILSPVNAVVVTSLNFITTKTGQCSPQLNLFGQSTDKKQSLKPTS